MKISYSTYELQSRAFLGKRTGSLLRCKFEDGTLGYADCHPWPELGDLPLQQQLKKLAQGKLTPLTKRARYFANLDAKARAQNLLLFTGLKIPPSHMLMSHFTEDIPSGISRIKIKLGRRFPKEEISCLQKLLCTLPENVKVRLDFNGRLSRQGFEKYLMEIGEWREKIDFIEDPFPYCPFGWEQVQNVFGVRLACDRDSEIRRKDVESHCVSVIKPAIQDESLFNAMDHRKIVITSYLDHPLGQLSAAFVAAKLFENASMHLDQCGLLTHEIYQTTEFSAQLKRQGPTLLPPSEGTGFGFDKLLEKQKWQEL